MSGFTRSFERLRIGPRLGLMLIPPFIGLAILAALVVLDRAEQARAAQRFATPRWRAPPPRT